MHHPDKVRPVTKEDIPTLVGILTSAFMNDPVIRWFFPDENQWEKQVPDFFRLHLKQKIRTGTAFTDTSLKGAALWDAPNNFQAGFVERVEFKLTLLRIHGLDLARVSRGRRVFEALHPGFPHWYLSVIGVDHASQGQGIGTALVRDILAECDALELPAYVETAQERGVQFYERLGFTVTGEHNLPDGPAFYSMLRSPVSP